MTAFRARVDGRSVGIYLQGVISPNLIVFTFCSKDARCCPWCGAHHDNIGSLRVHIEVEHPRELLSVGRLKANRLIFWRSKRGIRRVSKGAIVRLLKKSDFQPWVKDKAFYKLLKTILSICLVHIKNDTVDPASVGAGQPAAQNATVSQWIVD